MPLQRYTALSLHTRILSESGCLVAGRHGARCWCPHCFAGLNGNVNEETAPCVYGGRVLFWGVKDIVSLPVCAGRGSGSAGRLHLPDRHLVAT